VGVDLADEEMSKSSHILHIVKPKAARHLAISTIRCIEVARLRATSKDASTEVYCLTSHYRGS
jgi:hypothetical protein